MRLSRAMKQMLVAALRNPKVHDSGTWYRLPSASLFPARRRRYWLTWEALKRRGLVEYTQQPFGCAAPMSYCGQALTASGVEVARGLHGAVDFTGCVSFRPPPYS